MKFNRSLILILLFTLALLLPPAIANATDLEKKIDKITACGEENKSVNRLLAAVLDTRIKAEDAEKMLDPILDICEQGYPVTMYFQKMDEGLGKRVPGPRIIAALKKMHNDFSSIHNAVSDDTGSSVKTVVISATAAANDGVQLELITNSITKYKQTISPDTLSNAFLMAGAMGKSGFSMKQIGRIVSTGLESGTIDTSWKYVSRVIAAARSKGIPDSILTTAAVNVLEENGNLADFMVKLGFSERNRK